MTFRIIVNIAFIVWWQLSGLDNHKLIVEFMQSKPLDQTTTKKEKWDLDGPNKTYPTSAWFCSPFNLAKLQPEQEPFKALLQQEPWKLPQQEDWSGKKRRCSHRSRQTPFQAAYSPALPSSARLSSEMPKKDSTLSWWSETVAGSWNTVDYLRNLNFYQGSYKVPGPLFSLWTHLTSITWGMGLTAKA